MGVLRKAEDGRVVAADFDTTRAFGRRAVEIFEDKCVLRVRAVVGARGCDVDTKKVSFGRRQGNLRRGAKYDRADI